MGGNSVMCPFPSDQLTQNIDFGTLIFKVVHVIVSNKGLIF